MESLRNRLLELIDALKALPAVPEVALRPLDLDREPDAQIDDYSGFIERDASLAGKFLGVANVAWLGVQTPTTRVRQAVAILGLPNAQALAMSHSLSSLHAALPLDPADARAYWEAALCKAVAARVLAGRTVPQRREEAFAGGLFQDVAIGCLVRADPAFAQRLRDPQLALHQQMSEEASRFGVTHAEAGRLVAERLDLPELYRSVIDLHHDASVLGAAIDDAPLAEALAAAALLPHDMRSWKPHDVLRLADLLESRAGDGWPDLAGFVEEVETQFAHLAGVLAPESGEPTSLTGLLREAAGQNERSTTVLVDRMRTLRARAEESADLCETGPGRGPPAEGPLDTCFLSTTTPNDPISAEGPLNQTTLQITPNGDLLGEHARAMSALLDFSERVAVAKDLDTVIDDTLATTGQLLCSRRVSIMLPDAEGAFLSVARSIGMDQAVAAAVRVPVGTAAVGRVFQSGEPLIVNTPGEHSSSRYDAELFVSMPLVSVALRACERTVGVLNVTERQGDRPFTPIELEYVNLIGRIAASVIDDVLTRSELDQARDSLVVALANLAEYRDNDTGRHVERVSEFAVLLAEELRGTERFATQIDEVFLEDLKRTVPLHDIGKVAIPDHVLLKPGKLTEQEAAIMRRHSAVGAAAIQSVIDRAPGARFLRMAEDVAHAHHEWYDGAGYPRGLQGDDIPLAARIAALADVYDAITTRRPYKEPMPHDRAVAIIRELSGSQFDPALVDAFLRREPEFARVAARLADDAPTPPGELCAQPRALERTGPLESALAPLG